MTEEEIRNKIMNIIEDTDLNYYDDKFNDNDKYLMKDYNLNETDYNLIFIDIDDEFNIGSNTFAFNEHYDIVDHTINEIVEFINKEINEKV